MKKKYPIIYLLEIPVEIVFYCIVVELGAMADNLLFGGAEPTGESGRFPYLTVIIMAIATVLLAAAIIASIVNCIRYSLKKYQKRKAAEATLNAPDQE